MTGLLLKKSYQHPCKYHKNTFEVAREGGMAESEPRLAPLFAENRHRRGLVFGRTEHVPKAVGGTCRLLPAIYFPAAERRGKPHFGDVMQVGAGTEPSHHAAGFCIRMPQLLTLHHLPHHAHPSLEVDLHEILERGGIGVNGNCTLINKIFQNFRRSIRCIAKYCFVHFLHFAIFFPETTTYQSKNVTFIILILNELNVFCV